VPELKMKATAMKPKTCLPGHSHYWLIQTPDGPFSHGECRWCHERRLFANAIVVPDWREQDTSVYWRHGLNLARRM